MSGRPRGDGHPLVGSPQGADHVHPVHHPCHHRPHLLHLEGLRDRVRDLDQLPVVVPNADVKLTIGAQGGTQGTVAGLSVVEDGGLGFHRTKFVFVNMPLTVRNTETGGGVQIYDFPDGYLYLVGGIGDVTITTTSVLADTLNCVGGLQVGRGDPDPEHHVVDDHEQDLVTAAAFTSSATISVANTATTSALVTPAFFDGTTTAKNAFFNISVDAAGTSTPTPPCSSTAPSS